MAESTIHYCSWKELEEFLEDTKRRLENCKESELIQFKDTAHSKLNFWRKDDCNFDSVNV